MTRRSAASATAAATVRNHHTARDAFSTTPTCWNRTGCGCSPTAWAGGSRWPSRLDRAARLRRHRPARPTPPPRVVAPPTARSPVGCRPGGRGCGPAAYSTGGMRTGPPDPTTPGPACLLQLCAANTPHRRAAGNPVDLRVAARWPTPGASTHARLRPPPARGQARWPPGRLQPQADHDEPGDDVPTSGGGQETRLGVTPLGGGAHTLRRRGCRGDRGGDARGRKVARRP